MRSDTLDPIAILAALGLTGPARATPVTGGIDTALWRVEHAGQVYALRVFSANQFAQSEREIIAMRAAKRGGIPVPEICAVGTWQDRPALLLSWRSGQTLRQALLDSPTRAIELGIAFGRTQAAIHALPAPAELERLATPWIEWADPDDELRQCLLARARRSPVLIHLDYHPLNVLVEDGQVSAVLDWANSGGGDPRADLALTASILSFIPTEAFLPDPTEANIVRRALVAGWRQGYREVAGPVRGLAPFYAWAGAARLRDLEPRVGRPDIPWLTTAYLDRIRQWSASWRKRSGCQD